MNWDKLMDVVNIAADVGLGIANQNNQLKMLELQETSRKNQQEADRAFRTAEREADRAFSIYKDTRNELQTYKRGILEKGYSLPDEFQTESGKAIIDGTYQQYVDLNEKQVQDLSKLTEYMNGLNKVSDVAEKTETLAGAWGPNFMNMHKNFMLEGQWKQDYDEEGNPLNTWAPEPGSELEAAMKTLDPEMVTKLNKDENYRLAFSSALRSEKEAMALSISQLSSLDKLNDLAGGGSGGGSSFGTGNADDPNQKYLNSLHSFYDAVGGINKDNFSNKKYGEMAWYLPDKPTTTAKNFTPETAYDMSKHINRNLIRMADVSGLSDQIAMTGDISEEDKIQAIIEHVEEHDDWTDNFEFADRRWIFGETNPDQKDMLAEDVFLRHIEQKKANDAYIMSYELQLNIPNLDQNKLVEYIDLLKENRKLP
tara:strand:- start:2880 stop:4154 length:1275 start_codon:yes stop_codon:yes gene_type:complete